MNGAQSSSSLIPDSLRGEQTDLNIRPLHQYLETAAIDFPDRPWLNDGPVRLTFTQGRDLVERIATWLVAGGLLPGDRVALLMPNCIPYALFAFACWRQGIVLVGLNPLYSDAMLQRLVQDSRPVLIVAPARNGLPDRLGKIIADLPTRQIVVATDDCSDLPLYIDEWEVTEPCSAPVLAVLQYTGGTTGVPKGAMLSHNNISACVEQILFDMTKFRRGQESFLALGPFSHVIGSTLTLSLATSVAAEIVIPERFHAEQTTQYCLDRRISVIFAVPTVFGAMANSVAAVQGDWSALVYAMCGGAPLPLSVQSDFERVTGRRLLQGYGSSETSSAAVYTAAECTYPIGSVGKPMVNCAIDILLPNGMPVAGGEIGEICVTGPNVMEGYWTGHSPLKPNILPGRFPTGDSGCVRDGYLFVVDRLKDVIIASGYNIYPAQVEEVLCAHPAIVEVAVIGVPDSYRGETVKAVAVLHPKQSLTLDTLQMFARDKLSAMEMPRILQIVDALPRTAVGKIAKTELR